LKSAIRNPKSFPPASLRRSVASDFRLGIIFLIASLVATPPVGAQAAEPLARAAVAQSAAFEPRILYVKFRDDLPVRLAADGRSLTDRAAMGEVGGAWSRVHDVPEARLDELRATATKNLGRPTPDHNTEFFLTLPDATARDDARTALAKHDEVQHVGLVPRPVAAPTAPDFTAGQGYLLDAAQGHGSSALWQWPGGRGENVRICDIEYSWNLNHVDLPTVIRLGPAGNDPFNNTNHGTAVLGVMLARADGAGTTGMCASATGHVVPAVVNNIWNIGSAITTALTTLAPGDVLALEQQVQGPNWPGGSSQLGLVPCDWVLAWYNAVVTATGNGVTVIEAAGNGSQNLDDAVYSTGNGGHWPFLPTNDSGAVIVGGGLPPPYLADDRTRSLSSNYGGAVDAQSWAAIVTTLGYGQLYNAEGANVLYTSSFSGTSSATAIVAGAAAQLQSLHLSLRGVPLTPLELRAALRATGIPQQGSTAAPASQSIGPRPNLVGAVFHALTAIDCDNNTVPDEIDLALSPSLDADDSGGIDACERPCGLRLSLIDNAPALIPDNMPSGLSRAMSDPGIVGQTAGVVVWVELTHPFIGDVSVSISNGVTTVPLFVRPGREGAGDGDSSNFEGRYVFSDAAASDLWSAAAVAGATSAAPPGAYRPTGAWNGSGPAPASLSDLLPEAPGGPWMLTVNDERTGDKGTLIRWGVQLTVRDSACCLADFDGDGLPGVPDIFAFLAAWFATEPAADIDLDGTTNVPDIFAFLGAWFAGCDA